MYILEKKIMLRKDPESTVSVSPLINSVFSSLLARGAGAETGLKGGIHIDVTTAHCFRLMCVLFPPYSHTSSSVSKVSSVPKQETLMAKKSI